nr:FAD-binding protein [Actinomycetota bacterium]
MALDDLRRELCRALDTGAVLSDPAQLATYECDGLTGYRVVPALVVLPTSTSQVAATVLACARRGVPFVARGAGTGLSGGALPHAEGVLIVLSRMRRILDIDVANQRMVVEPGVTNAEITRAVAAY